MKKLTLFFLICLWGATINAQINIGGKPYSFEKQIKAIRTVKNKTDKIVLPPIDIQKIQAEDEEDEANGIPPRFGYPYKVDLNLFNSGERIELENGDRLWKLEIHCPSAKSINLLYDEFWLPEKGQLYIYNTAKTHHIGGFTNRNNKGSKNSPGKFGTGLVYGDRIILEYFEPFEVKGEGKISISWVIHGYRYINILSALQNTESFGESGDCQVNVNCSPEGDNWQDEKKSVALILVSGTRWCTGSLINNTSQDGTPYFLTADHCLEGWAVSEPLDAIYNPDASDWSFYWNYESPGCADGTNFTPPSTSGATVIANKSASDFALFRLTEKPSDLSPRIEEYFNGWDRNIPGQGGVGIHHPAGDIKKIATHNITPPATSNCMGSSSSSYWKINWQSTDNGHSVTEGGSSGSPLYNSDHRVIGQLYGSGYCPNPNCSDPQNDIANYGKFSVSWGNSTEPRRRLKDWLDPNNTGATTLDGIGSPAPPTNLYISGYQGCMPRINWTASTSPNIDYYELWCQQYNPPQGWQLLATTSGTWWVDSRVTIDLYGPEDTYCYKALAVNTYGLKSIFSNSDCVNVDESPPWFGKQSAGELEAIPEAYALRENYPNPFNPTTTIRYELPEDSFTELRIYDLMGREIRTLVNGNETAGYKNVLWDGKDMFDNPVSSGMYVYKISARSLEGKLQFSQTRKMILLR